MRSAGSRAKFFSDYSTPYGIDSEPAGLRPRYFGVEQRSRLTSRLTAELAQVALAVLNSADSTVAAIPVLRVELIHRRAVARPAPEILMAQRRKSNAPKAHADIFSPTARKRSVKRRPGRPPVHDEAWTKVTVVLFNRQIVFLDRLAANIRAQSGAAISRAQLIRALLDASSDADIDLTAATSEADLKATILARLGRYRKAEGNDVTARPVASGSRSVGVRRA